MLLWLNGGKRQPLKLLEKKFSPRGFDSLQKHQMENYAIFDNFIIDDSFLFSEELSLPLPSKKCRSELRKYLHSLGYKKEDMEILITKNGKPYFRDIALNFSFSHKKNYCAYFVSRNKVGIDLELFDITKNYQKLAQRLNIDPSCFLEEWTKREAILKINGGILIDLLSPPKGQFKTIFLIKNKLYIHLALEN